MVLGIVQRGVAARLEDSAPSWAASGRETALRARGAAVCSMAWGAGRCATGGSRSGSQALRLRFFAECRLARGRSAPRRLPRVCLGSPPFARRGSVLPMRENGPPEEEGVAYFQTLEQRAASENFAQLPSANKLGQCSCTQGLFSVT